MIEKILQRPFSLFFQPRGVEDALRRLVPSMVVREVLALCHYPGEALERIAKLENYRKDALLAEVGSLLNIPIRKKVHFPSVELVETIAVDKCQLRSALVVPQENSSNPNYPILAVADPLAALKIGLHREQMELCFCSDLVRVWSDLDTLSVRCDESSNGDRQLMVIIRRLARDARRLGATEIFVGSPSEKEYEFFSNGQVYRGAIASTAVDSLDEWIGDRPQNRMSVTRGESAEGVVVARATGGATKSFVVRLV